MITPIDNKNLIDLLCWSDTDPSTPGYYLVCKTYFKGYKLFPAGHRRLELIDLDGETGKVFTFRRKKPQTFKEWRKSHRLSIRHEYCYLDPFLVDLTWPSRYRDAQKVAVAR